MSLAKIQFWSLVTKAVTTMLGIVQSLLVVRFLSPAEFGLVGLVMSIGGAIGVSQHLGIVDGAIREIAVRNDKDEIGRVFWVSQLIRQLVTIPLSLALLLLAQPIAVGIYGRPEIVPYLMIFALVLILQGFQDVLGASLTGMKKFGSLYVIQIVTATLNVAVFGLLTWFWGIAGFFWAVVLTTTVMVGLFGKSLAGYLRGHLRRPSWSDVRVYGRTLFSIGAFMYLSRIFFVLWQRLPLLMLGGVLSANELGYMNVSLTFGSKLTIIAMALSEVNLSWMSTLYMQRREEFRELVIRNMKRVFLLLLMLTLGLLFFVPEILQYVIGEEYLPAAPLILLVTLAFFLYALLDIGTSSLFVAADEPKLRALVFGVLTGISGAITGWLLWRQPDALGAAWALLVGAVVSFGLMVVIAQRRFKISFLA